MGGQRAERAEGGQRRDPARGRERGAKKLSSLDFRVGQRHRSSVNRPVGIEQAGTKTLQAAREDAGNVVQIF
jgi:hypothetical protein